MDFYGRLFYGRTTSKSLSVLCIFLYVNPYPWNMQGSYCLHIFCCPCTFLGRMAATAGMLFPWLPMVWSAIMQPPLLQAATFFAPAAVLHPSHGLSLPRMPPHNVHCLLFQLKTTRLVKSACFLPVQVPLSRVPACVFMMAAVYGRPLKTMCWQQIRPITSG